MGKFIIGVDAGGTKTAVVLADIKGNILSRVHAGPFEYLGSEFVESKINKFLIPLLDKILSDTNMSIDDCEAIYMGVTGAETVEDYRNIEKALRAAGLNVRIRVENDAIIAFNAATNGKPGVMVIAGTGSVAHGEDGKGNSIRVGGLGPIIGDEGSGYNIGRRGIMSAIKSEDGRDAKTILENLIKQELKLKKARDIQFIVYRKGCTREEIASIAPIVTRAADFGDKVALNILKNAGIELGKLAVSAIKALHIRSSIVVGVGSIFKKDSYVFNSFKSWVIDKYPKAKVTVSEREPVEGAIILAIRDLSKS